MKITRTVYKQLNSNFWFIDRITSTDTGDTEYIYKMLCDEMYHRYVLKSLWITKIVRKNQGNSISITVYYSGGNCKVEYIIIGGDL